MAGPPAPQGPAEPAPTGGQEFSYNMREAQESKHLKVFSVSRAICSCRQPPEQRKSSHVVHDYAHQGWSQQAPHKGQTIPIICSPRAPGRLGWRPAHPRTSRPQARRPPAPPPAARAAPAAGPAPAARRIFQPKPNPLRPSNFTFITRVCVICTPAYDEEVQSTSAFRPLRCLLYLQPAIRAATIDTVAAGV